MIVVNASMGKLGLCITVLTSDVTAAPPLFTVDSLSMYRKQILANFEIIILFLSSIDIVFTR